MSRSGHGGDWAGYESEYGKEPLDFSMNVNPLGIPRAVAKAIAAAAPKADRYPDPQCRRLKAALAEKEGVEEDWIYCGNGAADIIDRIALAFGDEDPEAGGGRALVTAPTFSEYEQALERCGWEVDHLRLDEEEDFRIVSRTIQLMKLWEGRLVFLCEPNNPTGLTTDRALLEEGLKWCEGSGKLLVIDECFNGFLDEPGEHTMKDHLKDHPNLIILKAFTKLYGMAGVRLGYCLCSDGEKLRAIDEVGQPWNVSYIAEEAGLAALREDEYLDEAGRIIGGERQWLKSELAGLEIEKIYGEANYILFRWDEKKDDRRKGGSLAHKLRHRGILVRDCSNYEGLGEGWYRIAVRKHEENVKLVEALKELKELK